MANNELPQNPGKPVSWFMFLICALGPLPASATSSATTSAASLPGAVFCLWAWGCCPADRCLHAQRQRQVSGREASPEASEDGACGSRGGGRGGWQEQVGGGGRDSGKGESRHPLLLNQGKLQREKKLGISVCFVERTMKPVQFVGGGGFGSAKLFTVHNTILCI